MLPCHVFILPLVSLPRLFLDIGHGLLGCSPRYHHLNAVGPQEGLDRIKYGIIGLEVTTTPLNEWVANGKRGVPYDKRPKVKGTYAFFSSMDKLTNALVEKQTAMDFFRLLSLVLNDSSMTRRINSVKERQTLSRLAKTVNSFMYERGGFSVDRDGRLTFYIQHEEPTDPNHRKNWLPAPQGDFRFAARFYGPYASLIFGTYTMSLPQWVD